MTPLGWCALLVVSFFVYWLEAMYGRVLLKEHLAVDGWTLRKAQWRPTIPFRQARFRFDAERDGRRVSGRARLGGYWSGPVFSKSVELDWDEDS